RLRRTLLWGRWHAPRRLYQDAPALPRRLLSAAVGRRGGPRRHRAHGGPRVRGLERRRGTVPDPVGPAAALSRMAGLPAVDRPGARADPGRADPGDHSDGRQSQERRIAMGTLGGLFAAEVTSRYPTAC